MSPFPSREGLAACSVFLPNHFGAHLILICIHESATTNAPLIINGAPSLQRRPWSHVFHTSFPETCFFTLLVTLFTAWHASDFVPAPYKLKQWPGLTIPLLLVTFAKLKTYKNEQHVLFHCIHPHTVSLRRTYAPLFHTAGFDNVSAKKEKKKRKTTQAAKTPHINRGKGATWEEKPLHQRRKGGVSEDQEGCEQTS